MSYENLPDAAFWRRCLADASFRLADLYAPRVTLSRDDRIATAGSCFAQKIGRELRQSSATFLDVEPVPYGLTDATAAKLGFGLFSARYGNIYTTAQLFQLVEDCFASRIRDETFWSKGGRWFDGLRPRIEPEGFTSRKVAVDSRLSHLDQVARMFREATVFVFTLGLTERWEHAETGTVFPLCPAAVDPVFADPAHRFHNARTATVAEELRQTIALLRRHNPGLRFLLTVSPVPLMATATGGHVLAATARSKAVLRAAVDEVCTDIPDCDYFPSYEIVTHNPLLRDAFGLDQREVRDEVVELVMQTFFAAQPRLLRHASAGPATPDPAPEICDEILLDAVRG